MPDNDGAATQDGGRPRCPCHDEPMDNDGPGRWGCAVRRRERQLTRYHANPALANYGRTRRALRARIALKRARIEDLETHEAQD